MSQNPNTDDYPNLGDRVTFEDHDGTTRTGTVIKKVSVGDLRSYDVQVGTTTPVIVFPRQIVGHPSYVPRQVEVAVVQADDGGSGDSDDGYLKAS